MGQYRNQIIQLIENNPEQLSFEEYSYITETISQRNPGNFLIFGVGKDSGLWIDINATGTTVFLEDNQDWLKWARETYPGIEAYLVEYDIQRKQWRDLLSDYNQGNDYLLMELPERIIQTTWDFIFVDAPPGYSDELPGRMKSIYMAAKLAFQNRNTDVFVHDCDREVENIYTDYFLHKENLVTQFHRLKHYRIGF